MNKQSIRSIQIYLIITTILLASLSCRFIPSRKSNDNNKDASTPVTQPHQAATAVDSTQPEVATPENQASIETRKPILQMGGNTYAIATIPEEHYALAGVGTRIVLLDLELMVGSDGRSAMRQNFMWQSDILPGVVRSISVVGNYAYVAAGRGHVVIFDVADPLAIKQVSDLPDYQWAMSLIAVGDRLFVADNALGLWAADITNPELPEPYASINLKLAAAGLAYAEPYIYLVDMSGGLNVYDMSDPSDTVAIGHLDIPQGSTNIILDGKYGFISAGEKGLWVVDLSDPTNPKKVAERSSTMTDGIVKAGDMVYLTDFIQGLLTYDVSRPEDPQLVNSLDVKLFNQGVPGQREMEVMGNRLLIANQNEGVLDFDISEPAKPVFEAKFVSDLSGAAFDVVVQDTLVCVTRDYLGLGMVSMDAPEPFFLVSSQPDFFSGAPVRTTWKHAVSGNHVYQADMNRGLVVVDITDTSNLTEVAQIARPRSWSNVLVQEDLIFGTTVNASPNQEDSEDIRSLRAVDVSNPDNPQVVGFLKMDYNAKEVAIASNYLYYPDSLVIQEQAGDGKPELHVIDISNPSSMAEVNSVYTSQSCPVAMAALVSGNVLYVGDNQRGVCVFDITNPQTPVFITRVENIAPVMDMSIGDGKLYVAAWGYVSVLSLADPLAPLQEEMITTPGLAYGVAYQSPRQLFVADTDGGLLYYLMDSE